MVEQVALYATIQDLGRSGVGHLGVSPSGAFDRPALRHANALVGNHDGAAGIECLRGGLTVRATRDHRIAVAGAVSAITLDGRPVEHGRMHFVRAGSTFAISTPTHGLRNYVAVAGGIAGEHTLGSQATDSLSGLGTPALQSGDELRVGQTEGPGVEVDVPWAPQLGAVDVNVVLGPRDDHFTPASLDRFLQEEWTVSGQCDRIGIRLNGPALERTHGAEVPSEPCVCGSVQITPDGTPIVFGPDHPVTGGYPVLAVVVDGHTDRLAQVSPGDRIRFARAPLR